MEKAETLKAESGKGPAADQPLRGLEALEFLAYLAVWLLQYAALCARAACGVVSCVFGAMLDAVHPWNRSASESWLRGWWRCFRRGAGQEVAALRVTWADDEEEDA